MTHILPTDAQKVDGAGLGLNPDQIVEALHLGWTLKRFQETLISTKNLPDPTEGTDPPPVRNIDGVPHERGTDGIWRPISVAIPTETTRTVDVGEGEDVAVGSVTERGEEIVPATALFDSGGGGGGGGTSFSVSDVGPVSADLQQQRIDADADRLVLDLLRESNAIANDAASLELQRDQLALAERQGDRSAAIQLAQLAEQTNSRLDQRQLTLASLKQNAQIARAQITSTEQMASLDRAVRIAGLAENARQFNAQERRLLASEIADAAARPGDVVKQEALIQAASQAGSGSPISTSIAQGESAITDASLLPLQMFLDAQGQLGGADSQLAQALANILGQAGSGAAGMITDPNVQFGAPTAAPTLFGRPPTTAPTAAAPAPTGFQFSPEGTTNTGITGPFSGGRGTVPITESQAGLIEQNAADLFQPSEGGPDFDFVVDDTGTLVAVPKAEGGGVFNMAKVHDGELVIDLPDGFAVIPKEEVENAPSAQEGGLFTNFGDLSDTTQARSFLSDALSRVFGRVQEAGLRLPPAITPVAASTPGTSPGLQQLMAAIASARSGISPESFLAEAQAVRPRGVPGLLPARRTA